jgi:hypothetical protein
MSRGNSNRGTISQFGFGEIKTLKKYIDEAKANELLHKLAATVLPLMTRKGWRVPELKEFFPKNPGLLGLNVNHGQSILIRLRPANDQGRFYDWEHCLGTLLHELTHIVIGPHNAEFYKMLDTLDDEVQKDIAKGSVSSTITSSSGTLNGGAFFVGQGHKLGSGPNKGSQPWNNDSNMSRSQRATLAAAAASSRHQTTQLTAGSGSRLGGREVLTKEQLRERAAAAAQRRLVGDSQCGSNWDPNVDHSRPAVSTTRPAAPSSSSSSSSSAAGRKPSQAVDASKKSPGVPNSSSSTSSSSNNNTAGSSHSSTGNEQTWECELCFVRNPRAQEVCSFCCSYRTDAVDTRPSQIFTVGDDDMWMCVVCAKLNPADN